MRYFFSTGEPSGELVAVALAKAIAGYDPEARFEGIGGERMRAAGIPLWRDNTGWATIGPFAAIPRIPSMLRRLWQAAAHLAKSPPDLLVLIDFGAFNIRLAAELRKKFHYTAPIVDCFPPGAWLTSEKTARRVAALAVPLTAFRRQYDFYKRLNEPVAYFGHPLVAQYTMRPPRPTPPVDGGTIALLPGSRAGEIARHLPRLLDAYRLVRATRPDLHAVVSASDATNERRIRAALRAPEFAGIRVVRGLHEAIADADAAWIASGTAVLEAALAGVPSVALYVVSAALAAYFVRIRRTEFVTLPNLILDEAIVPELLQHDATPERLAAEMETLLRHPATQVASLARLRAALGPDDALDAWAKFAVALAKAGRR